MATTVPTPSIEVPPVLQDQRRMTYAQIRREIRAAKAAQRVALGLPIQVVRPRRPKKPDLQPKTKQGRTIKRIVLVHPFAGQELKRAKRTLTDPDCYCEFVEISTFQIPIDKNCMEPDVFAGQVIIQDHIPAIRQALSEHDEGGTPRLQDPGRQVFHVDAAVLHTETTTGLAVVHQVHRHVSEPHWLAKGYHIEQRLNTDDAEAWAISRALQLALEEKDAGSPSMNPEDTYSSVVIYSDSISVLRKIKNATGWSGVGNVKQKIVDQSKQVQRLGTEVELHWVLGHKNIPGNALADIIAKRARQFTQRALARPN
ncbi:MAG: hypothetical protein Q9218_005240 [Villophora microphyllina]